MPASCAWWRTPNARRRRWSAWPTATRWPSLPFTLALAAGAWLFPATPIRALAVLVVATPCPLILAAPVAIVAGLSRAARAGVIVKGGEALEALARAEILLLDKTGTLTLGSRGWWRSSSPAAWGRTEVLRLAASLETASGHVLAPAIVRAAKSRGLQLSLPEEVRETPGEGIEGKVDGRAVRVGKLGWVAPARHCRRRRQGRDASSAPWVVVDGVPAGALVLADVIRTEARATISALRAAGIREVLLLTGDRQENAAAVGASAGVDRVIAEASPPTRFGRSKRPAPVG